MKYFLESNIVDDAGNHIALAASKEITADEVIAVLKRTNVHESAPVVKEKAPKTKKVKPEKKVEVRGRKKGKGGTLTCKKCGRPGHMAKTCGVIGKIFPITPRHAEQIIPKHFQEKEPVVDVGSPTRYCIFCKKTGHTVDFCTEKPVAEEKVPETTEGTGIPLPPQISEEDWNKMREQHDDGDSPSLIRLNFEKYETQQIKAAMEFNSHVDYLIEVNK